MKKYLLILITIFIFINNVSAEEFSITSNKVILYNLNENRVIYHSNENEITKIASLTKIVSAMVAIENISNLDDIVTVSSNDVAGYDDYAKVGLKEGMIISYRDLLYAMILSSGADATNVIYNNVFTTNEEYINKMNELILKLNLTNTHFDNPIGIDSDNNYSTASDIAIILKYALSNEIFKTIFTTKSYYIAPLDITINNFSIRNNITGAKTGFTDIAGLCLASTYTNNNIDYLEVLLGSDTTGSAVNESLVVYNYFNDNYSYKKVVDDNKTIKKIKIKYINKYYNIKGNIIKDEYIKNDLDLNSIKFIYTGLDILDYNNTKKEKIGKIAVVVNNEVIDSIDIYLSKDIKKYYYPYINNTIIIIISLILLYIVIKILKKILV